jgi:hypothetical protein
MNVHRQWRTLAASSVIALLAALPRLVTAADDPSLTKAQMETFLATARVVKSTQTKKGVTNPYRLTLSDGTLTHDASFQSIDEREIKREFQDGTVEFNFVDSYKYNIAGYRVADLLGLDDMVPMYVERSWKGRTGSIGWWLPVVLDEADRVKRKVTPPDVAAWNRQMYDLRVFDALIDDTDFNLTNFVIDADWHLYRVDFSRAFRLLPTVRRSTDLVSCGRDLLTRLRALTADDLATATGSFLTTDERKALLARRDDIVRTFDRLIAERGEAAVVFD